jgi:hypothetical protein
MGTPWELDGNTIENEKRTPKSPQFPHISREICLKFSIFRL